MTPLVQPFHKFVDVNLALIRAVVVHFDDDFMKVRGCAAARPQPTLLSCVVDLFPPRAVFLDAWINFPRPIDSRRSPHDDASAVAWTGSTSGTALMCWWGRTILTFRSARTATDRPSCSISTWPAAKVDSRAKRNGMPGFGTTTTGW